MILVLVVLLASGDAGGASAAAMESRLPPLPPLPPDVQVILDAADDDTDRLGEPVAAVLDVVRAGAGGEPDAIDPPGALDVPDMLAAPDRWRGRLVRVAGRLDQIAARPAAGDDVREWFVRTDGGPVAVLVVQRPGGMAGGTAGATATEGDVVQLDGWVIRRATASTRDGARRRWPLVVAAPGRIGLMPDDGGRAAIDHAGRREVAWRLGLVVVMAGAVLLLVLVRRRLPRASHRSAAAATLAARRARRASSADRPVRPTPADSTLPPNAADALATLRARADRPAADHAAAGDEHQDGHEHRSRG